MKREELKRKQSEIEALSKELSQKSDMIKLQAEKLRCFQEKAPQFHNSILEQKIERSQQSQHIAPKGAMKTSDNNEINNGEGFSRRKTSISSVSGSNRSAQTHNSVRSGFDFVENSKKDMMDSSFL